MNKLAMVALLLAGVGACTDAEEVWMIDVHAPSTGTAPCDVRTVTLFLTDHGGGDVAGHAMGELGELRVSNVGDKGYEVAIDDDGRTIDLSLQRTDRSGGFPDLLSGTVHVSGSQTPYRLGCDADLGADGKVLSRDEYMKRGRVYGQACSEINGEDCPINWSINDATN